MTMGMTMDLLNRLSIRNKLISVILAVSAFSLIVGFTIVILNDISTFEKDLAESVGTITRIIADYSVVDLAFKDSAASQKTLALLAGVPTVEAAYLYDPDGRLFSSYVKKGTMSGAPKVKKPSAKFDGGFLHVFQSVQQQGKDYGTIYLKVSTEPLQIKVRNYLIAMVALTVALMAISLLAGLFLQGLISKPILDLADMAKKISEQEDFSVRVPKVAEDEIGTLSDGFNKMLSQIEKRQEERDRAEEALRKSERLAAIGEFAAVIAHEMRNSLGSISLNFRFLSEKLEIPDAYRKNLDNIQLSIHRMQTVIKDILEFSRPAPPVFKKVSIEKVLDSSILTAEKDFEQADVLVKKKYSAESGIVSVDANQISLVFMNLFLNAIQSMPSGGTILVHTQEDLDHVRVCIQDTGKGIAAENLEKIFSPFFTTRPEGVGLGLAIVFRTLEQHHAKINVLSEVGNGTTFTIEFPVAE